MWGLKRDALIENLSKKETEIKLCA